VEGREQGLEQGLEQGREEGLEQGLAQGREQGLEQGRVEGREEGLEQAARALMAAQGLTPEAALDLLGVEPAQRERVLASLSA
jgi:flagellar biosynthesis/type III secretory pathway protein FliH